MSKNKTDRQPIEGGDRSREEIAGIRSLAIGSIELSVGSLPLPFGFVFSWVSLLELSLKAEKEPSASRAFVGADDCGHERGVSRECRLVEARRRSCCSFEEWNSDSQTVPGFCVWI